MKKILTIGLGLWVACLVNARANELKLGVDCLMQFLADEKQTLEVINALGERVSLDRGLLGKGRRVGLIANKSSRLSPQRKEDGLWILGEETDDALFDRLSVFVTVEHGRDLKLEGGQDVDGGLYRGKPNYSLYSSRDKEADIGSRPSQEMLEALDVLVFDMQGAGPRCYTYLGSWLRYVLPVVAQYNKTSKKPITLVVLDRPNPLGRLVDGLLCEKKWLSLIGPAEVPFCHGLSDGEFSLFENKKLGDTGLKPEHLLVVPLEGWTGQDYRSIGRDWVPTSPNMATLDTLFCYPMMILPEGLTCFNCGRGEAQDRKPFQYWIAAWIKDAQALSNALSEKCKQYNLFGVTFSPYERTPCVEPFKTIPCKGFFAAVTDPRVYKPIQTQLAILECFQELYPKEIKDCLDVLYKKRHDEETGAMGGVVITRGGKLHSHYHHLCWLMGSDGPLEDLRAGTFCAKDWIDRIRFECGAFQAEISEEGARLY